MAKRYGEMTAAHQEFIAAQKIFFVGTAAAEGRVNVSPKGMDSLRVMGPNRVMWLNVTGSGNETAAHVAQLNRMTLMFCSFEGAPLILRLYGQVRTVHQRDSEWNALLSQLKPLPGSRQIFDMSVELVQTSCGMGVPLYEYEGDRTALNQWAMKKGDDGIEAYWAEKNRVSLDGFSTGFLGGGGGGGGGGGRGRGGERFRWVFRG